MRIVNGVYYAVSLQNAKYVIILALVECTLSMFMPLKAFCGMLM